MSNSGWDYCVIRDLLNQSNIAEHRSVPKVNYDGNSLGVQCDETYYYMYPVKIDYIYEDEISFVGRDDIGTLLNIKLSTQKAYGIDGIRT